MTCEILFKQPHQPPVDDYLRPSTSSTLASEETQFRNLISDFLDRQQTNPQNQNMMSNHKPLIVWQFTDGKAGHDAQSDGLLKALSKRIHLKTLPIDVSQGKYPITRLWQMNPADPLLNNAPDLLVGAGRRTHLPMLFARFLYGAKAIVLMKPDWPLCLWDLCIVPAHDQLQPRSNLLETVGPLNPLQRSERQKPNQGLILLGGPSNHYRWNHHTVVDQVLKIRNNTPSIHWTLTTSRRTPSDFLTYATSLTAPNLQIVPYSETTPGWVQTQMASSAQAWVTSDSAAMVYEALTVGCAVGMIDVPARRQSRIVRGVAELCRKEWVTPFKQWEPGTRLPSSPLNLTEAERCAHWIVTRWEKFLSPQFLHATPYPHSGWAR